MRRRASWSSALVAVLVAWVLVGGEGAVPGGMKFPYTFRVADEDYLIIHGHRVRGEVVCRWSEGEPLYMNEFQISPPPRADDWRPSQETWCRAV